MLYLSSRSLPLIISLSEDATRIVDRIQYDSRTNQIIRFVPPINAINGLPVPYTYRARNTAEIAEHFVDDCAVASFLNVIMAQPVTSRAVPPFCLLLFGSDNKYSSDDVSHRWRFITNELRKLNIKVLTISSDSDPKYNSCMRKESLLGCSSNNLKEYEWFKCGVNSEQESPFFIQDMTHIATKLRNHFLKTKKDPRKLPFGKYFIQMQHLSTLVETFSKDKHNLSASTLNPIDRQNFDNVLRMCDSKVTELLRKNVVGSLATIKFLEIVRGVIDSYMNPTLKPWERIEKIWYALFMIRIWRHFILSQKNLTLKDNFLTLNCYVCIELNAHSLVLCLLHLKNTNMPELFLPHLFGSQQCESLFRQVRSFTSTYSTVANCSVKEILSRISKIQLQSEIAYNNESFKFPRLGNSYGNSQQRSNCELLGLEEIHTQIEASKTSAIKDAINIGLLGKKEASNAKIYECKINPHLPKDSVKKQRKPQPNSPEEKNKILMQLHSTLLKNYSEKFENKCIDETSPYTEIFREKGKRLVVKKTSLCWLLRKDWQKISADRLQRVQASVNGKPKRILHYELYHKKPRK